MNKCRRGEPIRGASVGIEGGRLQLPPRSHSPQQPSQPNESEAAWLRDALRQCQVSIYGTAGKRERCDADAGTVDTGVHLKD